MTEGYQPSPPPVIGDPPKVDRRRGPRKPKEVAATPKKPGRPKKAAEPVAPKQPKIGKTPRKPRALKVDLSLAMSALAGLTPDDAKLVTGMVQALQPFSKKARARIVEALAKVVA